MAYLQIFTVVNLWAFGFIATRWMMESIPPTWGCALRFLLGFVMAATYLLPTRLLTRKLLRQAFVPGLCLGLAIVLQTLGLRETSVASNAFITTLYVVMVPFLARIWTKDALTLRHLGNVALALCGMYLLTGAGITSINRGDIYTFLCAIMCALHILTVQIASREVESAFAFNTYQALWSGIVSLIVAPFLETFPTTFTSLSLIGLFIIAGPVLLGAFTLQVVVQRRLPVTTASLLFLLESPLAAIYGYFFFAEGLSALQIIGAVVVFVASALAIYQPAPRPAETR